MKWLTVLLIVASPLAGAAGNSLPLDRAVSLALERAPQIAARNAALDAASSMSRSAGRLPDPTALIGIDNLPANGPDAWSTSRDFMTMRKIGVMQEFPAAARRKSERARAQVEVRIADADLAAARVEVARAAAQAWITHSIALQTLQALRDLQSAFAINANAARGALRAGGGSTLDALETAAADAKLRTRLLELEGVARESEVQLARWVGDEAALAPDAFPSLDALPLPAAQLRENVHRHADVLPLELRIEAARADVDLARAARRPDWSVELSYAKRGADYSDMAALEFRVGLPWFARNRQNPIIAARSAELRRAESERDTELRMHQAEVEQMLVAWERLGAQIRQVDEERVPLARERERAALGGYRAGSAPLRAAVAAIEDESELLVERAVLVRDRGFAWAYLRYSEARHLDVGAAP